MGFDDYIMTCPHTVSIMRNRFIALKTLCALPLLNLFVLNFFSFEMGEITVSWVILGIKQDNMQECFALGVCYLYFISTVVPGRGARYWRKERTRLGGVNFLRSSKAHATSACLVVGTLGVGYLGGRHGDPQDSMGLWTIPCS